MAVTVIGHWELSWNTPLKESELWQFPLREFGVEDWVMFPVTGIRIREPKVTLIEAHTMDEALELSKGVRVFVEPAFPKDLGHVYLPEFDHPEDVTYIFGSAHLNPAAARKTDGDIVLAIPTLDNKGALWPHQCLLTILYDRLVKSWQ